MFFDLCKIFLEKHIPIMEERPFWCHCDEESESSSSGSRDFEPCKKPISQEESEPKLCFHRIKNLEKKVEKLCGEVGFNRKCTNREIALSRCLSADLNLLEDSNKKCLEKMEQLLAGYPKFESDFVKVNGDLDKKLYDIQKENEGLKRRLSQLEKKENVLNSEVEKRSKNNTDLQKRILELNEQFSEFRIHNDKALNDYKKYANECIKHLTDKCNSVNVESKETQVSNSSETRQIQNVQHSPTKRALLKKSEKPVRKSSIVKDETSRQPFKKATSPKRKTTPKKRPTTVHHDCECSIAVNREQLKELQDLCNNALNQNRSSIPSTSKAPSATRRISINPYISVLKSTRSTSTSGLPIPTASIPSSRARSRERLKSANRSEEATNFNNIPSPRTVEQARKHLRGRSNKASQSHQATNTNNVVTENLAKAIGQISKGTHECLGQLKKINVKLKGVDEPPSNDISATLEQFVNEREECMKNFRKVNTEYNCGQEVLEKINAAQAALDDFKKQADQLKKCMDKAKTTKILDDNLKDVFMQSYKSTATYYLEK